MVTGVPLKLLQTQASSCLHCLQFAWSGFDKPNLFTHVHLCRLLFHTNYLLFSAFHAI